MTDTQTLTHGAGAPNSAPASNPTGWSFYERAKRLIPGGTQLLSKRPENFLPGGWPCYYSRAKGCRVWDLEGRELIDMTLNGIGSCLLGFADDDVNAAVKDCIDRGSMSTLNAPAEVTLAETLLEIHPWARRVRYARSGGESMMIAVRIARAFTGRSGIALCGYHGWGDWYLAANLGADRSLDGHLLPGLQPEGVPRELTGTVRTFRYNRLDELEALLAEGFRPAAIVMEPLRHADPAPGFLEGARDAARRAGAVLIFDEITAGWRFHLGGVHRRLGVEPDVAVFAKGMSNGFPMAAVVGTEPVMQASQGSFISSTYWTEAIGPTAASATIAKMRRVNLPERLRNAGLRVREGWVRLGEKHRLGLTVAGWPALGTFSLACPTDQAAALRTLLTQEMLDRGFLATTAFYATLAHDEPVIDRYLSALDEVFSILSTALTTGTIASRLRGPVAHSGFARLT